MYSNVFQKTNPFTSKNVSWLLEQRAASHPDKVFLSWEPANGNSREWTFSEFTSEVVFFASGLKSSGVNYGDFVVIHLENCPEFLFAWFACVHLGAVPVTTNIRSSKDELSYFIEHSQARFAITETNFVKSMQSCGKDLQWIACVGDFIGSAVPAEQEVIAFSSLRDKEAKFKPAETTDQDICCVQYTSGTTNRPKGVVWTHANALWGASVNATHYKLSQTDISLIYLPLFHTNAICYSMLSSLWAAATIVLQPKFSASRFWPLSLKHCCTWASTIPTVIHALTKQSDPSGKHNYRFWGGATCNIPGVFERWGINTIGNWGMTETISHGIVGSLDLSNSSVAIGMPANEYAIRIVDTDGDEVEIGGSGHLLIKGTPGVTLFLEYLNNKEATEDSYDDDGWFITGDLVMLDHDGSIVFLDREKDVLKVGGENVSAAEIERIIMSIPNIQEAAVVSLQDEFLDEVPAAFVISNKASKDLPGQVMKKCKEMLADFKVPTMVTVVDELPRITLNKVDKKLLRAQLKLGISNTDFINKSKIMLNLGN
jgi:crotonobetaine/carnitine-CoA ligase